MIGKLRITSPDDIQATLEVTMRVREWRQIKHQLGTEKYSAIQFANLVSDLIRKAEREFHATEGEDE